MSKRHAFRIPIGDWSDDGHGKVEWFDATATKPIEDVREAYFAAKKRLPEACCPENFCEAYGEPEMNSESREALKAAGYKVPKEMDAEAMAKIVAWFINQGDPSVGVRLDGVPPPMLPFYGNDKKRRHIGGHGYGLFS
jgi:hypothetical protein